MALNLGLPLGTAAAKFRITAATKFTSKLPKWAPGHGQHVPAAPRMGLQHYAWRLLRVHGPVTGSRDPPRRQGGRGRHHVQCRWKTPLLAVGFFAQRGSKLSSIYVCNIFKGAEVGGLGSFSKTARAPLTHVINLKNLGGGETVSHIIVIGKHSS